MSRLPLLAVICLLAAVLASCGGDGGGESAGEGSGESATAADLEGRVLISSQVTGRDLAPGSEIELTFDEGRLDFNAGCNSVSAPYVVEGGELRFDGEAVGTLVGCPPELQEQDDWLTSWLNAGVAATIGPDGGLTLESDGVVVELTERES